MELLGVRILVVDDRLDYLELFAEIFDTLGAQTRTAPSADAALHELKSFHPHVVVSDLEMPGKDGYRLLKELRAEGMTMPVIAATGNASEHHRRLAAAAGFAAFLAKPASFEAIVQTVNGVLGSG